MNRVGIAALTSLVCLAACGESNDACDPIAQAGCEEGLVCEEVIDAGPDCFAPVLMRGKVFELANGAAIEGATVVALDVNRAPVSTVAMTDVDGSYELQVPRQRDADGNPAGGDVTLRADAAGFQTFPGGVRQALPIELSATVREGDAWLISTALTDVGLVALPEASGTNILFGSVELPQSRTGVLVVAEASATEAYTAIADRDGAYRIFNVPDGELSVLGYAQGVNYEARDVSVSGGESAELDLSISGEAPGAVTGAVQMVNPGDGDATSYILVVESTFNAALARGESPPGLRAPEGGAAPDLVSGSSWVIEGVPAGRYKVLGAFENDLLVRDPDFGQGNTEVVDVEVVAGQTVEAPSFKITGALEVLSPGAQGVEEVIGTPSFSWVDDSGEARYLIEVFDNFGEMIWSDPDVPSESGADPEVIYGGPGLQSGMFYQFRVTSFGNGDRPLSRSEDLKGVFFLP
jgi:hypothetical protein